MMYLVIAGIILLATLENFFPFIIGLGNTPDGYVFLGTVHHPADYFYYLSQFAQGEYRWITTVNLFTSEQMRPTLVGWSNVMTGRVFHIFGLSPFFAYHASIVIYTVFVLISGYFLILTVLKDKRTAVLGLYLFTLFHAFPVLRDGKPSYGDYWNNFAVPRVRLGGVPHQLLLNAASFLLVYFIVQWENDKKHTWKTVAGLGATSFILASLQPVLWALILAITGATILLRHIRKLAAARHATVLFLVLCATGLPPVIYLTRLFETLPFSQLRLWEAAQQTPLSIEHFISATGPIFLVALFSLPVFVMRMTFAKTFVIFYPIASVILFLSPLPGAIGISRVRLMSTLTIVCISTIASFGIGILLNAKRVVVRILGVLIITGLSLLLLPNHMKTIRLAESLFDPNNAYYYLPASDYRFLQESGRYAHENETFLVTWPYHELFPALTGKRSYHGHPLITIKSAEKDALATKVFNVSLSEEVIKAFLTDNRITYVIATADNTHIAALPFLTRVAASNTLILYRAR